jgi:RimJ/RimL family protein N-acetyltransferase
MAEMTDPSNALASFQQALEQGALDMHFGRVDPTVRFYFDLDGGVPRFTYVKIDGGKVAAFATFVPADPIEGQLCFQCGYAVPEAYRGQGKATDILSAGIAELRNGFAGDPPFWVEAVVGLDNLASQRVAEKVLEASRNQITDQVSGQPALQFQRRFDTGR